MSFSWVPFYREVAQTILTFEGRQGELISLLQEMKATGLLALPIEGPPSSIGTVRLKNLDPFTFLAKLSNTDDTQVERICEWIRFRWNLQTATPTDFEGLVRLEAPGNGSWFFSADKKKKLDDIPLLWQLAKQAFDSNIAEVAPELLTRCLNIENVTILKLTTGLFWFSPQGFLPLAGAMLPYLEHSGVPFDSKALVRGTVKEYRHLMQAAKKINSNIVTLSNEAWLWRKSQPDNAMQSLKNLPYFPLNQILYGPPGTGKTFHSISQAVEIIDGRKYKDREQYIARFEELREAKQIEFVTFHQSFSYEEFIEGLRPVLADVDEGTVRYEIRNGILKQIALRASAHASSDQPNLVRSDFEGVWAEMERRINSGKLEPIQGLSPYSRYSLYFEGGELKGKNLEGGKGISYRSSKAKQQRAWDHFGNKSKINSPELVGFMPGETASGAFIAAVFNFLKVLESELSGTSVAVSQQETPRYVLIIDEINRGNISKILGELITLLEEDKRIGKTNALHVTLPVSQDLFSLPPNLYLLGTMNTADKSLALLDVALRRRFSFTEMPPLTKHFPKFASETLQILNMRLEAVLDREHRLGHAYFIDCQSEADFNRVFCDKIIPLLQEFFYNDWETLRAVLGESGEGKFIKAMPQLVGLKTRTKWRWWFDVEGTSVNESVFPCLAVLKSNYAKANNGGNSLPENIAAIDGEIEDE